MTQSGTTVQRGCIISRNDGGTLERVDGTNTFIGSATKPDGRLATKRFRGNMNAQQEVIDRWERWQRKFQEEGVKELTVRVGTEEEGFKVSDNITTTVEINGLEQFAPIVGYMEAIATRLQQLDELRELRESVDLLAMAVSELKNSVPVSAEAPYSNDKETVIGDWIAKLDPYELYNRKDMSVYSEYTKFCKQRGVEPFTRKQMVARLKKSFSDRIEFVGVTGGVEMKYKKEA